MRYLVPVNIQSLFWRAKSYSQPNKILLIQSDYLVTLRCDISKAMLNVPYLVSLFSMYWIGSQCRDKSWNSCLGGKCNTSLRLHFFAHFMCETNGIETIIIKICKNCFFLLLVTTITNEYVVIRLLYF